MRLILFKVLSFGKMWKNMEKWPFFRAAMAGLGKYHTGGYGRIGVHRVKRRRMPRSHRSLSLMKHSHNFEKLQPPSSLESGFIFSCPLFKRGENSRAKQHRNLTCNDTTLKLKTFWSPAFSTAKTFSASLFVKIDFDLLTSVL